MGQTITADFRKYARTIGPGAPQFGTVTHVGRGPF